MRCICCVLLVSLCAASHCAEEPRWPLWDGVETVTEYAKKVNLPSTKTLDLGNGVKMELVLIPAGKFIMGSPEPEKPIVGQTMTAISGGMLFLLLLVVLVRAWRKRQRPQFSLAFMLALTFVAAPGVWGGVRWHEALKHVDDYEDEDEHPAHEVTLKQPFYMGKFDVTQEQYQQLTGTNPSNHKGKDNPVENVSWDDAQEFFKKLSALAAGTAGVSPANGRAGETPAVRLPTEAEWEYTCRAGSRTKYYSGDTEADLDRVAWYDGNSKNMTHPVGQKEPNRFGLYDMHGNVWQWCQDWYGDYSADVATDPQGPAQGSGRVSRGGSWDFNPGACRAAGRDGLNPDFRNLNVGFRLVTRVPRTP